MNNKFIINERTTLKNNNCVNDAYNNCNNKVFDYNFSPSILKKNNSRNEYINSIEVIGILQNSNYDINGNNINQSTELRNSNIQNGSKRELDTRLFPGAPLLITGESELKNTDLSSQLKFGKETRTNKSTNSLKNYSVDNFIPLVPYLAENVQNTEHIIPTYWVRGGMSSRTVVRNIDYLKSCGMKK
jgi:hypothetical protein